MSRLLALSIVVIFAATGCRMCACPYDYCGPVMDGGGGCGGGCSSCGGGGGPMMYDNGMARNGAPGYNGNGRMVYNNNGYNNGSYNNVAYNNQGYNNGGNGVYYNPRYNNGYNPGYRTPQMNNQGMYNAQMAANGQMGPNQMGPNQQMQGYGMQQNSQPMYSTAMRAPQPVPNYQTLNR